MSYTIKKYYKSAYAIYIHLFLLVYAIVPLVDIRLLPRVVFIYSDEVDFLYAYQQWFYSINMARFFAFPVYLLLLSPVMSKFYGEALISRFSTAKALMNHYIKTILLLSFNYVIYFNVLYLLGAIIYKQFTNIIFVDFLFRFCLDLVVYLIIGYIYLLVFLLTLNNVAALLLTYGLLLILDIIQRSHIYGKKLMPIVYWINLYNLDKSNLYSFISALALLLVVIALVYLVLLNKDWLTARTVTHGQQKIEAREKRGNKDA